MQSTALDSGKIGDESPFSERCLLCNTSCLLISLNGRGFRKLVKLNMGEHDECLSQVAAAMLQLKTRKDEKFFLEAASMELSRHKAERILAPNGAPVLPDGLWDFARDRFGASGCKAVFLCRKPLTATDVNPNKNRLLFRRRETVEVLLVALTSEEENLLMDRSRELQVVVIHQRRPPYDMKLTYWRSKGEFALIGGWTNLVETNDWKEGTPVSIWFFRYGQERKLGFFISSQ